MRIYQQIASVIFAALGVFLVAEGVGLKLEGEFGPGPGFMAFVVGALLIIVSAAWGLLVSRTASTPIPAELLPDREGTYKVVLTVAALLLFAAIFDIVGFKLAMFGFLLAALFVFGRDHPIIKIVVAVLFSFGLFVLFVRVLRVPLPGPSIEALAALGF
jgi:putative tricarboxylic transport membrane protein